jgi:hypothetical protein
MHRDSNSQSASSVWNVGVPSLTLSYTPRSMKCDSRASLLAHTLQALALVMSPRLGLQQKGYCDGNTISFAL